MEEGENDSEEGEMPWTGAEYVEYVEYKRVGVTGQLFIRRPTAHCFPVICHDN